MKSNFRTFYDTKDFDDSEVGNPESMTDSSCYIPTQELIKRFMNGEIIKATDNITYDEYGDALDDEHNTNAFNNAEAQEKVNADLENLGEEALATKLSKTRASIKQNRAKVEKAKEALRQGALRADLSHEGASKGVQPALEQAALDKQAAIDKFTKEYENKQQK